MKTDPLSPTPWLTRRQLEVLDALAKGLPNKAIARRLGVSESTIATHLKAIFQKLHVHTRLQAVRRSEALGFLPQPTTRSAQPDRKQLRLHMVARQKSPK